MAEVSEVAGRGAHMCCLVEVGGARYAVVVEELSGAPDIAKASFLDIRNQRGEESRMSTACTEERD